ncbi:MULTISPECIES: GGDEF domain-containing protein [Vibrio]|uniref:GGDEF domain-containing protein n=1 Tax=Vibrio kanaloae TaxID=170673 RepID=A0A4V6WXI6_9VIBR|nr:MULTISPECIES: GGDEF domain-containing protein [Vibrio]NAZ95180.1 diguanylate cyclase [Vibrio toranzoniae]NOH99864.1 GGDEF domain-containing protein [Vibrio kanaloae]TKE99501.1 GGDEF domain-containing protein [Vibrio kanaloae]TKF05127.1 GGDEF domain-containing protein [Vibrio kanaloae]TKF18749.1 GGDEF domain-containing protein [Vibrio kanaloae]
MADIRSTRKQKIVYAFSLIAAALFIFYTWAYLQGQHYTLLTFELCFAFIAISNAIYVRKAITPHYSELILSCVLLVQGIILFLHSHAIPDRILWLYPILAAVIFINDFRIGVIFSTSFCVFISILITALPSNFSLPFNSIHRFILSLLMMSLVCHTSAYYYTKAVSYIQRLYKEGIEDLAYRDQLTGLANRWSFERWATEKLTTVDSERSLTALVFLDIDDFKNINDSYGHDVGDSVLQHFANRLSNNIRTRDRKRHEYDYSIARFAGDEFVLMLYDIPNRKDLDGILNRICGLFESGCQTNERIKELTLSVGVSLYPQDAKELHELTRCADKAMYVAKHSGKNRYAYYHDNPTSTLIEELPTNLTSSEPDSSELEDCLEAKVEGNNVTQLKTRQR